MLDCVMCVYIMSVCLKFCEVFHQCHALLFCHSFTDFRILCLHAIRTSCSQKTSSEIVPFARMLQVLLSTLHSCGFSYFMAEYLPCKVYKSSQVVVYPCIQVSSLCDAVLAVQSMHNIQDYVLSECCFNLHGAFSLSNKLFKPSYVVNLQCCAPWQLWAVFCCEGLPCMSFQQGQFFSLQQECKHRYQQQSTGSTCLGLISQSLCSCESCPLLHSVHCAEFVSSDTL